MQTYVQRPWLANAMIIVFDLAVLPEFKQGQRAKSEAVQHSVIYLR